jgi:hypothetical protein
MNGIPTGIYTAQVFVWSTRAKNSVPGYCLGASMPAAPNGIDPVPLCGVSTVGVASSTNPNPEVLVQNVQTFNVSLVVFDTTQIIQITPSNCPTSNGNTGFQGSVTEIAGVANSENLFTGNIAPPAGPGSVPNYPNFGPNANSNSLVEWSLLPFQTTGTNITGCSGPSGTLVNGGPCPQNSLPAGSLIPLPFNVGVNAQTLAQYNACQLPTGFFCASGATPCNANTAGAVPITGASVPGIGSLTQTGPVSQTTFNVVGTTANTYATIYACRPTVAPAWLNSPNYPGNAFTISGFPGGPEPYANGNGPFGGPAGGSSVALVTPVAAAGCIAHPAGLCPGGKAPVPSVTALTCPLIGGGTTPPPPPGVAGRLGIFRPATGGGSTNYEFLEDLNGNFSFDGTPTDKFITNFFPAGSGVTPAANGTGDIAVAGDWTGDGKTKIGIYRQSTGVWYLDANNNGIFDQATCNTDSVASTTPPEPIRFLRPRVAPASTNL